MKSVSVFCSDTAYIVSAYSVTYIHKYLVRDGECLVLNLNCSDEILGGGVRDVAKLCGTRPDPQSAKEWKEIEKPLFAAFGTQTSRQFKKSCLAVASIGIHVDFIKILPSKRGTKEEDGYFLQDREIAIGTDASDEVLGCTVREAIRWCDPPGPGPSNAQLDLGDERPA